MATCHTFLATDVDLPLILSWLKENGAKPVDFWQELHEISTDGKERVLYFPEIGDFSYFPDEIDLAQYSENSEEWRRAWQLKIERERGFDGPYIDPQLSPIVGLKTRELRNGKYWVSGSLWFPTINLKKRFPNLSKINGKLERWIRKFPLVFDNRNTVDSGEFERQICHCNIRQCIIALPDAYAMLRDGACMIDYFVSDLVFQRCQTRWRENGLE